MSETPQQITSETPQHQPALPHETITIKKDTLWKYSTFILAAVLIVGAIVFFVQGDSNNTTGQVVNNPTDQLPAPQPERVEVNIEGAPAEGKKNAPVVMVEYTDYQCPFCSRHFLQTYPQIKTDYIDTGKVLYVTKDFPLSFHENAQKAAEAAHCVREQKGDEGYFMMHDKLFENQQSLSVDNYKKWARELGANGAQFDSCLTSGKMASVVSKGLQEGQQDGVQGTPGFFINGKLVSGAQPFAAFKSVIDAELAAA